MAGVYDLFRDADDAKRAAYLSRFLPRGKGVDLGCGTGGLTRALYGLGYDLYGVERSAEMLQVCLSHGGQIKFVQADAARFPALHPLSFAVASCDVINYMADPSACFTHVYTTLAADGVFVFDVSSAYKLRHVLAGNTFSQTKDDVTYIWQNALHKDRLTIDFTVFLPQGETYIKQYERQTQYVHTQAKLTKALRGAGFAHVDCYGYYTQKPPTAKTERILFVAKKQ